MSAALELVQPEQVTSLVVVDGQCAAVEAWAEGCESVPELQDANYKLAAYVEYLDRTSTEGRERVNTAMRRLEVRIGELVGPAEIGAHSSASEGLALTRNERHQFRQMAAHPDVVEQVIADSTDDEPPSRRKVMQAIKDTKAPTDASFRSRAAVEARVAKAKEMAGQGHTSRQIAVAIGIDVHSMNQWRARHGVEVPADAVVGRPSLHDANRIVRTLVDDSLALAVGADLIDYQSLDGDEIEGWVGSLSESIRFLTTLRNNLKKELTQRG